MRPSSLLPLACAALLSPAAAQNSCQNEFWPVQAGWVWNYRLTADNGKVTTFTEEHLPTAQGGYTSVIRKPGQDAERSDYTCTGGAYIGTKPPSFGPGIQVTRAVFRGAGLPAGPWQAGKIWQNTWDLEGKRGLLHGTGKIDSQFRVAGRETVNVAAGKYETWRVEVQRKFQGKVAGIPVNMPAVNYTYWYAENVGLIKADYGKGGKLELLELSKKS